MSQSFCWKQRYFPTTKCRAYYDHGSHFYGHYHNVANTVYVNRSINLAHRRADWFRHHGDWHQTLAHDRLLHRSATAGYAPPTRLPASHVGNLAPAVRNPAAHAGSNRVLTGNHKPVVHQQKPKAHVNHAAAHSPKAHAPAAKPHALARHPQAAKAHASHASAPHAHAQHPAAHASHPKPAAHA